MYKRMFAYTTWLTAVALLAALLSLTGCGSKNQDGPSNDPSYYTGKDFRQNASKPTTKGGD
jgi:hypothetical protein